MNERLGRDYDLTDRAHTDHSRSEDQDKFAERARDWRYYENPDLREEDDPEEFKDEDQGVEHEVDHATEHDDSAESAFDAQYGWRAKDRRRGTWVSPDITKLHTPQFVPAANPGAGPNSASGEDKGPAPTP